MRLAGIEVRDDFRNAVDRLDDEFDAQVFSELAHQVELGTRRPVGALDGGPDGLDVIRRLLPRAPEAVTPGGAALLEIGGDQGQLIEAAVAAALPGWSCTLHADLSGSPRVAKLERLDG